MEKSTDRLVSIQFYLKHDPDDEDEAPQAMPQVGPTLPDELVSCRKQKLAYNHYYVDRVTIYQSSLGIDAMEFHVGD